MVQFGKRFETSQTRRWLRHNADYERLEIITEFSRSGARARAGREDHWIEQLWG